MSLPVPYHSVGPRAQLSSGCGIQPDFMGGGIQNFTMDSDGIQREYQVQLPDDYDADTGTPLLVAFHSAKRRPKSFRKMTGLSDPETNPDMITVYPVGIGRHWQGAPYSEKGVDDLRFARDLVEQIKKDFCIDEEQIYAAGHSNGGGLVAMLACSKEYGEPFAAFASMSSALYFDLKGDENCDVPETVRPMLQIHGFDDKIIPYRGGKRHRARLPRILEWVERWAERDDCDVANSKVELDDSIEYSWDCGGIPNAVRHVVYRDTGHSLHKNQSKEAIEWLRTVGKKPKHDDKTPLGKGRNLQSDDSQEDDTSRFKLDKWLLVLPLVAGLYNGASLISYAYSL